MQLPSRQDLVFYYNFDNFDDAATITLPNSIWFTLPEMLALRYKKDGKQASKDVNYGTSSFITKGFYNREYREVFVHLSMYADEVSKYKIAKLISSKSMSQSQFDELNKQIRINGSFVHSIPYTPKQIHDEEIDVNDALNFSFKYKRLNAMSHDTNFLKRALLNFKSNGINKIVIPYIHEGEEDLKANFLYLPKIDKSNFQEFTLMGYVNDFNVIGTKKHPAITKKSALEFLTF